LTRGQVSTARVGEWLWVSAIISGRELVVQANTIRAIRERSRIAGLTRVLERFEEGAEAGVTRLLTAFYFRQYGERDGDKTFEITHKSFGE
jgi:hypothetical protein